ncbi:MAG: hypothetical protein PVG14_01790 [Anaerolineales bacterium]
MSTLIAEDNETILAALKEVFQTTASNGESDMVVTFSNACPVPRESTKGEDDMTKTKNDTVTYHHIGYAS